MKKTAAQNKTPDKPDNFLKFLGTAGARFVMIRQLRASGGLWVSCRGTNVLIDPGPGSIVHCAKSRPKLDPTLLDGVILSHRHLDHCSDINVMIEAMTEGGFKKKGVVFCPKDSIDEDPVILRYIRGFPEKIEPLEPGLEYRIGNFSFQTSMRHMHPVETYGLKFSLNNTSIGLLTDTKYFPGLKDFYRVDCLIIGVVFYEPHPPIEHLSIPDVEVLIDALKPRTTYLTHFGMGMLKAKPYRVAEHLSNRLGQEVIAAADGMSIHF